MTGKKIISWVGYNSVDYSTEVSAGPKVKCSWCGHFVKKEEAVYKGDFRFPFCSCSCYDLSREE